MAVSTRSKIACLTLTTILMSGCSYTVPISDDAWPEPDSRTSKLLKMELAAFGRKTDNSHKYVNGLALSGGGIRSSLFALGLMKALYDQQVTDNIDVLSTVSGGGYTGYLLMTGHEGEESPTRFGSKALGSNRFVNEVCETSLVSNFVTVRDYASTAFPKITGVKLYESAILRTYNRGF